MAGPGTGHPLQGLLAVLFRYVSLASVVAASVLLVAQALLDGKAFGARLPITIFVAAVVALVVLRHVPNLRRLMAGTESKIGAKRMPEGSSIGTSPMPGAAEIQNPKS